MKAGLSVDGKLYAVPFYAESSFTMYRKDLFEKAGLTMPEHPTYDQIKQFADKLTDKANGIYGICLRGKAGLGREYGLSRHPGEHLWRPLVRHGLEAPADLRALEDGDQLLRRLDEG